MNVDGNATISHPEVKRPSEHLFDAVPPIESQESTDTNELVAFSAAVASFAEGVSRLQNKAEKLAEDMSYP